MIEVSLLGDLVVNRCRESATAGRNVNFGLCAGSHRSICSIYRKVEIDPSLQRSGYMPTHSARRTTTDAPPGEYSDVVRARVIRAREVQQDRVGRCTAHLDQSETNAVCRLATGDQAMLENAIDLLQLSGRSMHRIMRVARSIADLAGSVDILGPHVAAGSPLSRG